MQPNRALATYLKDHLAGSAAGSSLARRIARGADQEAERREMEAIASDIEADREQLIGLMDRLDVRPSRVKQTGAWVGEKLGAVKLNASKPDRRLLQYESLIMGVTGKLELWRSLEEEVLAQRAESQRARLEKLHAGAASALRG